MSSIINKMAVRGKNLVDKFGNPPSIVSKIIKKKKSEMILKIAEGND